MKNFPILNNLKIKKKIIFYFFCFLIINYIFFNYRILFRQNGYILGDWLINYQGGFAGRAFLGELFYLLSKNFNINPINIVFIFSTSCYVLFILLHYQNIKEHLNNIFVLILVLLPSTLLFNFFDPLSVGRKEILLLLLFSLYFFYIKNYYHDNKFKIGFFFISIIFMLTHEILFFYLPYLFALSFIYNKESFGNFLNLKKYTLEILIFFSCFLLLVIMLFYALNTEVICQSLINIGVGKGVCFGVLSDFNHRRTSIIIPYFIEKNYFTNYFIYFFLSYIPIVVGILNLKDNFYKKKFFLISLFCLLFTVPFLLIVNDWGRYFFIHFILQSLLFLMMLKIYPKRKIIVFKNTLTKFLLLFFLIIYLGSWHMPHCCNPKLGTGYITIYDRIKFRLNDNSTESTKYKDIPREFLRKFFNIN